MKKYNIVCPSESHSDSSSRIFGDLCKLFTFFDPNQSQRPLIKSPFRTASAILAYHRYYFKGLLWPIFVAILSKDFEMVLNIFDAVIFIESTHCLRFY